MFGSIVVAGPGSFDPVGAIYDLGSRLAIPPK